MTAPAVPEVFVTGMGSVCAAGRNVAETTRTLFGGGVTPAPPKSFSVDLDKTYPVFEAPLPDPADFPARFRVKEISRTCRFAAAAFLEATEQAGLPLSFWRGRRVGICLGATTGCSLDNEPFYRRWRAGTFPDLAPIARYGRCHPALYLSRALESRGPSVAAVNACASGTDAVGVAADWIRAGLCDTAVAGGADALSRVPYLGFASLMVASISPCRPFDRDRDGLNLGEGAGILILESGESARRRSARPLARVAGYGNAADAWHPTAPRPDGAGLRQAIRRALEKANIRPEDVAFVNAHGTATPDNDRVEGAALKAFFPEASIFAPKAHIGHALGAAGALEAVLTVQALLDGSLPPTPRFRSVDPAIGVIPTPVATAVRGRFAVSTSLAFGGNNACLVFAAVP